MSWMIERVAAALCNKHGFYRWEEDFDAHAERKGNLTKDDYRGLAREAIEVIERGRVEP